MQINIQNFNKIIPKYKNLSSLDLYIKQSIQPLKQLLLKNRNKSNIYVSFNGGKDATVVLYLTVIAYHQLQIPLSQISCIYFQQPKPFQEVNLFIESTKKLINFKLIKVQKNFIKSLTQLKKQRNVEYIIMGSRRTDPYCQNLKYFSPSDVQKGYPEFIRVNPIINWEYQKVWSFLLSLQIQYCILYNEGYTYLGNQNNTIKNEHLFDQSSRMYKGAWQLNGEYELLSRKNVKY